MKKKTDCFVHDYTSIMMIQLPETPPPDPEAPPTTGHPVRKGSILKPF